MRVAVKWEGAEAAVWPEHEQCVGIRRRRDWCAGDEDAARDCCAAIDDAECAATDGGRVDFRDKCRSDLRCGGGARRGDAGEVEQRVGDDVIGAGACPRDREDVVVQIQQRGAGIVSASERGGVPNDVGFDDSAVAVCFGCIGKIEHTGCGVGAAGVGDARDGILQSRERISFAHRDGVIAVVDAIPDDGDVTFQRSALTTRYGAGFHGGAVAVGVEEGVTFHPSVAAVELHEVGLRSVECVVQQLKDGVWPLEIEAGDRGEITERFAKYAVANDGFTTGEIP